MISFILNIPYTIIGLTMGLISIPKKIIFNSQKYAFVINVQKFWWTFGYMRNARAMAIGHVVLMGQNFTAGDLEHEFVHIEQYQREPLIHPILYLIELVRVGYSKNKYEVEAYDRAGNTYETQK
jgi:hypothetical protein